MAYTSLYDWLADVFFSACLLLVRLASALPGGELRVPLSHYRRLLVMVPTDGLLPEGNPPSACPPHEVGSG